MLPVDTIYASVVVAPDGRAARFYWSRTGWALPTTPNAKPLVLLDFDVDYLGVGYWSDISGRLDQLALEYRARYGVSAAMIEHTEMAEQARMRGLDVARPIPDHLTTDDYWPRMCSSAWGYMEEGYIARSVCADAAMKARPFLDGFRAGPRGSENPVEPTDPTIPAYIYGVVLGLDDAMAIPPASAAVKIIKPQKARQ